MSPRLATGVRHRLFVAASLLVASCGGDGATSPFVGLSGVWRGHTPLGAPTDSILIILTDSANRVTAMGVRTFAGVARLELEGGGQMTGTQLELTLRSVFPPPGPSAEIRFDLVLSGSTLTGTMTEPASAGEGSITLRRTPPASLTLVGTWVLATVRGGTLTPGPDYTDTLAIAADGRARRSRKGPSCSFVAEGLHDSSTDWLRLELLASGYLFEGQCGYRSRDSLQVRGATLTRYTRLLGGATLEEDFTRR